MNHKNLPMIFTTAFLILNGMVFAVYFASLLFSSSGPSLLVPLFFGVPFFLLGIAGALLLGRIRYLPGIYLLISGIINFLAFQGVWKQKLLSFCPALSFIGIAASLALALTGITVLFYGNGPKNRKILAVGTIAAVVLLVAALVFWCLLSLLPPAGESHTAVPLGFFGRGLF